VRKGYWSLSALDCDLKSGARSSPRTKDRLTLLQDHHDGTNEHKHLRLTRPDLRAGLEPRRKR